MTEDRDLVRQLQELTREFIADLPGQLGAIEAVWVRICREGWESSGVEDLKKRIHSLAGTAGSLGFEQITLACNALQAEFKNIELHGNSSQNYLDPT